MSAERIVAGRFRIVRELGRGGMGAVFEAVNLATGRSVALKIPHPELAGEPRFRRRFLREVRAASRLRHAHVIDVLDVVVDDSGLPVAVMELLRGAPLSRLLAARGRLSAAETAAVVTPILRALHEAHEAGIVHRDLKPENVFLAREPGEPLRPKLLDFGVAKVLGPLGELSDASATQTGSLVGSPYYMAPEQVSGRRDLDRRADVWAAGVLVYECMSGEHPFRGENFGQIFAAILQNDPVPLASLARGAPAGIVDAVARALRRDRDARPATLLPLIEALGPHCDASALELPDEAVDLAHAPTVDSGSHRGVDSVAPTVDSAEAPAAEMQRGDVGVDGAADARRATRRPGVWVALAATALAMALGAAVALTPPGERARPVAASDEPPEEEPDALIEAARRSSWEIGEALAREAVTRAPSSTAARFVLAHQLLEKTRLASSGRMAALREARSILGELASESPADVAVQRHLVLAHYLMGHRIDALEAVSRLPDGGFGALDVSARVAWFAGWNDDAREAVARCLERTPTQARCLFVRHHQTELADGRAGLAALLEDSTAEAAMPVLVRARVRLLLGRVDEAALLIEAGVARGELDDLDRRYGLGMLAAARGQREDARAHLRALEALLRDEDVVPPVRVNGAWQAAELAAATDDEQALVRAANLGVEAGFWNADYYTRSIAFEPHQEALAPIVAACRERSTRERRLAVRRGVVGQAPGGGRAAVDAEPRR